jgi:hypothetical protein
MIPVPTLCRLEYWNLATGEWIVAHAGIALLQPRRYVERLVVKGKIGRVTVLETGEIHQLPCPFCGDDHAEPYDGSCLL